MKRVRADEQREGFDRSLADLMAGVAVVFLLLAGIFILRANDARKEAELRREDAERERKQLKDMVGGQKTKVATSLQVLHSELSNLDAQLDGGFIQLSDLPDGGLNSLEIEFQNFEFASGRCRTPRTHLATLAAGARPMVTSICNAVEKISDAGAQPSIILEGHTDNVRFGDPSDECGVTRVDQGMEFDNNVRASAARAQSVFFTIRDQLQDAGTELRCLDRYFVVSGRGQAAPKLGHDAGDEANRRLVIRVRGDLSL